MCGVFVCSLCMPDARGRHQKALDARGEESPMGCDSLSVMGRKGVLWTVKKFS